MILVDSITEYSAEMTKGLPSRRWCHMVSDTSEEELHAFAALIGLRRAWAQLRPKSNAAHYDLTPRARARALRQGAVAVTSRELVTRNYDGLTRRRAQKESHEVTTERDQGSADRDPNEAAGGDRQIRLE